MTESSSSRMATAFASSSGRCDCHQTLIRSLLSVCHWTARERLVLPLAQLPSSAGGASRIVARLPAGVATGPRNDADYIVTEYGMAALRDLDLDARAEALIMLAAPQFGTELTDAWREMRAKF